MSYCTCLEGVGLLALTLFEDKGRFRNACILYSNYLQCGQGNEKDGKNRDYDRDRTRVVGLHSDVLLR